MPHLARNAIWNIVGGMSMAIVSVALPPFLARLLDRDSFGAWALALQVAGYVNLLNFGMQVIVGRLVAHADALGDHVRRDRVVATSFVTLAVAGLVGVAILGMMTLRLDLIVPEAPAALRPQLGLTIILIAFSYAVQLPSSVFGAVFIGLRRNDMYAAGLIATRGITFVAVLAVAFLTKDLVIMGLAWLGASLVGALAKAFLWRRYSPRPRLALSDFRLVTLWDLGRDGLAFTVWNLAMLMVSGFQLLIVARVDFANVGAFAVASSIAVFVAGIMEAICSTLVPHVSHLMGMGDTNEVRKSLHTVTAASVLLSTMMSIGLISIADPVMALWMGRLANPQDAMILALLVTAQAVRNAMMAYVMVSVALGLQRRMLWTPILEGLATLAFSAWLGYRYGASGVALGVALGGLVGVVLIMLQNVLRVAVPDFTIFDYLVQDVLRPLLGFVFTLAVFVHLHRSGHIGVEYSAAILAIGFTVTLVIMWGRLGNLAQLALRRAHA